MDWALARVFDTAVATTAVSVAAPATAASVAAPFTFGRTQTAEIPREQFIGKNRIAVTGNSGSRTFRILLVGGGGRTIRRQRSRMESLFFCAVGSRKSHPLVSVFATRQMCSTSAILKIKKKTEKKRGQL